MNKQHHFAAAVFCLALVGCGTELKRGEANEVGTPRQDAQEQEWTAGIVDRSRPDSPVTTLMTVRSAAHDGFDRVVFEFDGQIPGYHTEYIDQPVRKCGSGNVTQVAGDGWLEVRMYPANAHTKAGQAAVTEREQAPGLPVLAELELTCDFEAVVTWILGVESPNRYRIRELSNPPRLVVEVRH